MDSIVASPLAFVYNTTLALYAIQHQVNRNYITLVLCGFVNCIQKHPFKDIFHGNPYVANEIISYFI
ncbi:MAG: hypothetical protein ABL857_01350, partial [Rickettsiales bacterium]